MSETTATPLVEVRELQRFFNTPKGSLHAVDGINMKIMPGETMGVVGESGCGKSTLGRTIIHLQPSTGGKIFFEGEDVTNAGKAKLRELREQMQIIFQDPYSTLNPRYTIDDTLREPLYLSKVPRNEIEQRIMKLMDMVGLSSRLRMAYPHELSGGRRQRVAIGRAIAMNPKFVVCDEPVASLDVSIQAQIINLLMDLQEEYKLSYMFITHDMGVVRHISRNISVMYLGQLVETSPSKTLFRRPLHPYTKALLSAVPTTDIDNRKERIPIKGELMSPINPKPGCRFAPRCPYCSRNCFEPQQLQELEPGHFVACCQAQALAEQDAD